MGQVGREGRRSAAGQPRPSKPDVVAGGAPALDYFPQKHLPTPEVVVYIYVAAWIGVNYGAV